MTDETTNGAALPVPAQPQMPAPQDFRAGTAALAEMPQREFDERLASMARGRDRLRQIHQELMTAETDYGMIPGTQKPTLLKPGAEKLLHFYRLCSEFVPAITYGDGETTPWITVVTECRLHLGALEGPVVNTGHGAANSWEKRYRRSGNENTAAFDMLNTLVKMSIKRAMVDAALRATATSGVYSQDMEDLQPPAPRETDPGRRASSPPAKPANRCYCDQIPEGDPSRPTLCSYCDKMEDLQPPAPARGQERAPEPPALVVCSIEGCGAVLSKDEVIAAGKYFGGTPLCLEHGKRRRANEKAEREAVARVEAAEREGMEEGAEDSA